MFIVVIGQSGAGKTTFVKERFITGKTQIKKDVIPYTISESGFIALGKYNIGKRTEGTDTLAYNAKDKIIRQLARFKGKNVVLEGDRINNESIFEYLAESKEYVQLYLITCSLQTSMERLKDAGSNIGPEFVKATKTKSKNMFLKYREKFNGVFINTEGRTLENRD